MPTAANLYRPWSQHSYPHQKPPQKARNKKIKKDLTQMLYHSDCVIPVLCPACTEGLASKGWGWGLFMNPWKQSRNQQCKLCIGVSLLRTVSQGKMCSLVHRSFSSFVCSAVLRVTNIWAWPGNEAKIWAWHHWKVTSVTPNVLTWGTVYPPNHYASHSNTTSTPNSTSSLTQFQHRKTHSLLWDSLEVH